MLALPRLTEAGFDKQTAAGLTAASGTLAILIPPSVMLIVLADQLQVPVPDMFTAALVPGALLVIAYGLFTVWRARKLPPLATNEKISVWQLIIDLGPLVVLVVAVLGSILGGIATPTEASGLGALGAIFITLIYGRFNINNTMEAARKTVVTTSMVLFVMIGATCFSAVFKGIGGDDMVETGVMAFGTEPITVLTVLMVSVFLLGFFLDWLEISLILLPLFIPIVSGLDFGNGLAGTELLVWFGILVGVNLQTSFLTPPFGFSLFYLKGAAGDSLQTTEIYRGVVPFIALQLFILLLLIIFPRLVTGMI